MAKSPERIREEMIARLPETTGKSLAEWLKLVRAGKRTKHGEIMGLLKSDHGLSHGYANLIALQAIRPADAASGASVDLVETQYAGSKASLRPIYDALVSLLHSFGKDVELSPKKAYVSVRRSKQFALIQPSTATRVDVGVNLKGEKPNARLEASGSFNAMVSHRVRVTSVAEIDAELAGWLRRAYDAAC
jgi:predicted transport protein